MALLCLDNAYNEKLPFRLLRDQYLVLLLDMGLPAETREVALFHENGGGFVKVSLPYCILHGIGKTVVVFQDSPESVIEVIAPHLSSLRAVVLGQNGLLAQDMIVIDPGLMRAACDPLSVLSHRSSYATKPGDVAVVTHCYNEGWMVKRWESHYGNAVGHQNLFIVDDGSEDGSTQSLHPMTNLIRIPRGDLDHDNMSQYCGYLQRFLLRRYKWVINTDCDEFLMSRGGLVADILALPDGIYRPEHAIMPVHRPDEEEPFRPAEPFSGQHRTFVRETDDFLKPMVASRPTTWSTGFHACAEPSRTMAGLWHVHLYAVDRDRRLSKDMTWGSMSQTVTDRLSCATVAGTEDKTASELKDKADTELKMLLKEREKVSPPDWLIGAL